MQCRIHMSSSRPETGRVAGKKPLPSGNFLAEQCLGKGRHVKMQSLCRAAFPDSRGRANACSAGSLHAVDRRIFMPVFWKKNRLALMDQFAKETLPISLEEEMRRSYLAYAMTVIVGRALPDVPAGL